MESIYQLFSAVPARQGRRTWAEIDLDALRHNYRCLLAQIHRSSPHARLIAVVKAEAYGHGYPLCVKTLLAEGCDAFAVASLEEGVAVREICRAEASDAAILILGYTDPACASLLAAHGLTQTLLSPAYAEALLAEAEARDLCLSVQVAVNTGMNRIGFAARNPEEYAAAAASLRPLLASPRLRIDGVYTHFARADEVGIPAAKQMTDLQMQRFRALRQHLEAEGLSIPLYHACNCAAALYRPEDHMDAARVGILLFGAPALEDPVVPLRSVMKLKTVVAHLHDLLPGESVGYGGEYVAKEKRRLATLPLGYADGLPRACTGARVTLHTKSGPKKATVVGRICMDQCMLDVTGLDVACGDEVTVFGTDPAELTALSHMAGSIDHELLCGISPRVPRIYTDSSPRENTKKE